MTNQTPTINNFEPAPVTEGCSGCWFRPDYTCCDKHSAIAIELDRKHGVCHVEKHIYILKEAKK